MLNFIMRRRFRRHSDEIVKLAVHYFDRPTDLKNALAALELGNEDLILKTEKAVQTYTSYPAVQADLKLACLRSICTTMPVYGAKLLERWPTLISDERANRSLVFYEQKIVNDILGIETLTEEPEIYEEFSRTIRNTGVFNPVAFGDSGLADRMVETVPNQMLMDLATSYDRTLNRLKDEIYNQISRDQNPMLFDDLVGMLVFLLVEQKSERSYCDFFVASLRALGEIDTHDALQFGNLVVPFLYDHRALRSLAVYHRRAEQYEDALRLLRHPNFLHDEKTRLWLSKMIHNRRHEILDGKFGPKFKQFGMNFEGLSAYVDDIYSTLRKDGHVARYIYSHMKALYEEHEDQFLANEVIRWGEAIDKIKLNQEITYDSVDGGERKSEESKKSYARVLRELRRLEDSVSLRLGNHITRASRKPLLAILLPVTLPILIVKLGLQRLGKTKFESHIIPEPRAIEQKHSILLFPTNGVGFGHFTRMYAVARALRKEDPDLEIVFFTPMPTLHILYSDNFPTYHIAGRYKHSNMSARQWNGLVEEMLTLIFEMHSPKWFIFDGAFPYRGMLNAIQAKGSMKKLWMQRGTLKKNKKIPPGTIELFDTVIRPQDVNPIKPNRLHLMTDELHVPPITLIEPHEMLERTAARAALSVPKDCTLVYVQLGAGRINDISSTVRIVIDELLSNERIHVVLGESLLGERTMLGLDRLHVIRDYPNALFLKAFDASVQAGGYNSFHEMRSIRVPTLFIPNTNTGMDDQHKRVMLSVDEGWGIVIAPDAKSIEKGISGVLNMTSSEHEKLPNGATEVAKHILRGDSYGT
tara:strand:+ start:5684 stop:8119 length:2436 start_codon:yes stop_codon:yes gene_type:complete